VDTRDKLFTYVRAGVLAPWSGTALPHPAEAGTESGSTPAEAPETVEKGRPGPGKSK
jgi:hypothetical protein